MTALPSGADDLANTLLANLTTGITFSVPDINLGDDQFEQPESSGALYSTINPLVIGDLTTGVVNGTGVFDKLMTSLVAHLKVEYEANRISGAEYTKAYVGVVGAALQTATQFLMTKDQAYWGSLLVQAQAKTADVGLITARIELETARVQAARVQFEAETAKVNYGLVKMKIASEDVTYSNLTKQGEGISIQNENLTKQGVGLDFTNSDILPKQAMLLAEQGEVQRAQTLNTRSDGVTTVVGVAGKQKDLYTQQIDSYKRDAEYKIVKVFSDAWIAQKTLDEGLTAPSQFTNTEINEVLVAARSANNLGS